MATETSPLARPIMPRGPVRTLCPECEHECDAYAGTCDTCGCEFIVRMYAPVSDAMCGRAYPYTLDGAVVACTREEGHEGDHESKEPTWGEIRAWSNGGAL